MMIDFMGRPALTTTMPAMLAVKYGAVIVPVETTRLPGMRFKIQVHPPLVAETGRDEAAEIARLTQAINNLFGSWIMQTPGQWLWMHDRWRGK
jgi:KDO2-lipid IV(A) lauroyltransferase